MSNTQQEEQIREWNKDLPEPISGCVHELISNIARRQPDAPAVHSHDGDFSYEQLDALSDRLAFRLIELGTTPRSIIPLYLEKTKWTPVAMLAVIKTGCAAIALDCGHPIERLRSIVQQADPTIIIASSANAENASLLGNFSILTIADDFLAAKPSHQNLPAVSPSDIVYISFTSGTTGVPKGAQISHSNVRSSVHYQSKLLGFSNASRVLDFAPYSFDVAWSNVLHTLCAGGCLCIQREQDMLEDLYTAIESTKTSLINVTPTVLRTLLSIPPSLKTVLMSGEIPYQDNITRFAGHVRLLNTYGPTEATFKCAFSILDPLSDTRPDVGRGVGFCTWICDPNDENRLMSIGEPGELLLESPMVGQGYLGDAAKTASAFIRDPPWLHRPGRLYKTGDLFKYKPDGRLLFVGRKDDSQLKIRGQRVELGDVQHHCSSILGESLPVLVDVVKPGGASDHTLALFVQVCHDERDSVRPLLNDLRGKLSDRLPGFMIPQLFIPIDEIPKASTGKTDRRKLRDMAARMTFGELLKMQYTILPRSAHQKPETQTERELLSIWASVLGRDPDHISMSDSFLRTLGGDSVSAIRVIAAAREKGIAITFTNMFRTESLSQLAATAQRVDITTREDTEIAPFSLLSGSTPEAIVREEAARLCGIEPAHIEDVFPCTPIQEGMLASTVQESSGYILRSAYILPDLVDLERFRKAWATVQAQSPLLRTCIVSLVGEGLVQVVVNASVAARFDAETTATPMGLGTPLCRIHTSKLDTEREFVLEQHHAGYDGVSRPLILDAVEAAYHADEDVSRRSQVSYQSFVRYVLAARTEQSAMFWRKQLSGCDATPFPPKSPVRGTHMDLVHSMSGIEWPKNAITPSTILRSALAILMASYTNSSDVLYGATTSGRQAALPGIEKMPGIVAATCPIRVMVDWDQTLLALLQQVQSQMLEIGEHEQYGLQHIQRALGGEEQGQFQLLLVVQPREQSERQRTLFASSRTISTSGEVGNAQFNSYGMMIQALLDENGASLDINFDSAAINKCQCERFAQQLEHLLRQICSENYSEMPLSSIAIAGPRDVQQIEQWNSSIPEVVSRTVVDLIAEQASMNPDRIAVSGAVELTYNQLTVLASVFAKRLLLMGLNAGDMVPLCLEKSAYFPVAMLAVMQAGAIVLPLSSSTSVERAGAIVAALRPKLAITDLPLFDGLLETVSILKLRKAEEHQQTQLPRIDLSAPALCIFTSGSTGKPKGIQWSHLTLSSNACAAIESFNLTTDSKVFQFAAYDFDVAHIETFAALCVGACLHIPTEFERINRLTDAINESKANWLCLTPSVSELLGDVPHVRTMVFAGEKLKSELTTKWVPILDSVYNWYGPAEASVATFSRVKDTQMGNIGRSSRFGHVWLVEPRNHDLLAPVGSVGEICIEGGIVSDAYIGENVDQSAFSRSELISGKVSAVYRTGDYGRYSELGDIIFLGRREDSLQKLRGQRIRFDDVEGQTQDFLKGMFEARVVVEILNPLNSDSAILVLFVNPACSASALTSEEVVEIVRNGFPIEDLEDSLAKTLPSNQIPRLYYPIVELPIGPTGKTDRRRLRQLGNALTLDQLLALQPSRREMRKPSTATEQWLQQLWATIIGIDHETIHADDHFFRLGGDSISAIRLVSMARNHGMRLKLTAAMIFQYPKLCDLALAAQPEVEHYDATVPPFTLLASDVTAVEAREYAANACQVSVSQIEDIFPTSSLQAGLLAMTAKTSGQYVSRSVLGLQGDIDEDRLKNAWRATVARMPILRTRIIDFAGEVLQVVLADLPMLHANDIEEYVFHDERRAMGLSTELCRAALVKGHFVFTCHHCLYDGVSLPMVLDTLQAAYQETALPVITPYQHFIKYLTANNKDADAAYWKQQLANTELQQFPALPSPMHTPQADQRLTRELHMSWPRLGITPSTILRSAWARLASQYTTSPHVIFGATVSGRQADVDGIDRVGGPTVSTVPIAVSLDMSEDLSAFLQRMQEQATAMVPHEQYGLQNIQALAEDRQRSLFQSLLVVQPVAEGSSLEHDSYLFKARTWAASVETKGVDPFNTYAIMLVCVPSKLGLELTISYDRAIMPTVQTELLASQFEAVLRQMCKGGDIKLRDIQVASPQDLEFFWGQNALQPAEPTQRVHDLITLRALQHPEKIAVDAWDGQLTYQDLDGISTTLSRKLISLGVIPGSVVLLSLERSKWTPLLQVAVLKAAGTSMLQSTTIPDDRLRRILKNIPAVLAIASEGRMEVVGPMLRSFTPEELMLLDIPPVARLPPVKMSSAAAILVSSGSTGEPKAILWSHTTLAANVKAMKEATGLDGDSRLFSFCSHDFDGCTIEMMTTLVYGGRLCIAAQEELHNSMASAMRRFECNIALLTPSASKLIHPDEVPDLATIILAGELLVQERVDAWQGRLIINWYGPCECSPGSFCTVSDEPWHTGVIGTSDSSHGARCWLVDPSNHDTLTLVARGTPGEIVLEGPACAVGYLGTEAPRDRFLINPPFLTQGHGQKYPGRNGRIYRTGDLAYFNSDGMLVFKGRKDSALKIRGQFVSPDEVEHHILRLLSYMGGVEVVVDAVSRAESEVVHLAAYIAIDLDPSDLTLQAEFAALRQKLGSVLSPFAVPTLYIPLPSLPLTSTGKVNRLRLREIGRAFTPPREVLARKEGPTNAAERTLQSLWAEVLRRAPESLSRDDSFLHIADSVQAMRMVSLAQRRGFSLTVADIFRHPLLKDMARCLTANKGAIDMDIVAPFALLGPSCNVQDARHEAASIVGVSDDDIEDLYPCTPLQEGLLALTLKNPGSYIGLNVLKLAPTVDLSRFKAAWERVAESTAILRTRMIDIPGHGLLQAVIRGQTHWSTAESLEDFIREGKENPIGLGTPLARFGLLTTGDRGMHFCLELHHGIYDANTLLMIREGLEKYYQGESPVLLQPFASFISYLVKQDREEHARFWKELFQDLEAPIWPALPFEGYQPTPDSTYTRVVGNLAWRSDGYTSSTLTRAAFSLVSMKYTNSFDFVFGTIVSGRKAALSGIECIAGPTISTLPVRVQIDADQTLGSFLSNVQKQETDSIPYEQTGLSNIRQISDEARQACQFQSAMVIQPEELDMSASSCFVAEPDEEELDSNTFASFNVYGLMLVCTLQKVACGKMGLRLDFSFDKTMIDSMTVSHLAGQLEQALRRLNDGDPNGKLLELSVVPRHELHQIWQWNCSVPPACQTTVHGMIAEVVVRQPNDLAISAADGDYTYSQLDRLSSRIARHLVHLGVGRNNIVPICFEKSKFNTVACLAVMKAGAAVLMLDSTQPEARLGGILQQTKSNIVVCSTSNEALCSNLVSQVVVLSDLHGSFEGAESILPHVEPSDLLFVIPTSGSTGAPKLCMLSHSNFSSASRHQQQVLQLNNTSRFYDFSSYAFDAAHFTMVHSLTNGATLCVPSELERKDRLGESIQNFRATHIFLTPTTARMIDPRLITTLESIHFVGEKVSRDDLIPWVSSTTTAYIGYGPAECTAWATSWKVPNPVPQHLSLGRAAGQTAWVVDPHNNQLAGLDHIGELYLEGSLVGMGYLGESEKTAAFFIDNPEWLRSGASGINGRHGRVYRTGDLVKLTPDGTLEFIGRKDTQVKLRGQRVELSAVEHHVRTILISHCKVVDLVAEVIVPKATQRPALVVFLQVDGSVQSNIDGFVEQVSSRLEEQLPGYMVPSHYIVVPSIPQTAGGKANRKTLRGLGADLPMEQLTCQSTPINHSTPSTQSEKLLQKLWAQVLAIPLDAIGSGSSFMRLSGDSISAMQLSALARRQGYSLSVVDILKAPMLSEMAKALKPIDDGLLVSKALPKPFGLLKAPERRAVVVRDASELCNVTDADIEDVYPTTAVQQSLLAVTSRRPGDYVARIALELKDDVDIERLKDAWEAVSKTSAPILRNRVVHIADEGLVQVQLAESLHWGYYSTVEEVLQDESSGLMGLAQRLTRMAILEDKHTGKTSCILIQSHAVHDGASLDLLLDQVSRTYIGNNEEARSRSPPFQAYIAQAISDQNASAEFWAKEFLGCEATPFPPLPSADYHPRANSAVQADIEGLTWPKDVTPSTVLRCAWAILTARYTDTNDTVFGALVTGRQAAVVGIERMIAPLIAALPIRVSFEPDATVDELLRKIQLQAIEMIPHEQSSLPSISGSGGDIRYNTLLVVQPSKKNGGHGIFDGPFSGRSELQSSVTGLDTFNPHAVMVMCSLRDTNGIGLEISFDSNVVDTIQAKRMTAQFESILRQICTPGTRRVRDVDAISSQDINQLWEWNATVEPQVGECIHDMIANTAQQDPHSTAIDAYDGNLTYGELEHYSSCLAAQLLALGAGPGSVIPLCFSKSVLFPIAALAVFKTGSAACSMDATQPERRLRAIVNQLHPKIILTSDSHGELARRLSAARVVIVNKETVSTSVNMTASWPKVTASDVLYVVFTSGSTGVPKGIVTTHANFASAAVHQYEALRVKKGSRVFDWVSLSFDVQWSNLLNTLIHGATLCIPSEHERRNDIAASLNRFQADYVYLTPSVAASLDPSTMLGIKTLAMGGEPIRSAEIARWTQTDTVIGIYGPAECAQALSIVPLTPSSRNGHVGPSFGARTWLIVPGCPDKLAAIGTVGELMIEGPTVAREYFEAKDKTDAAFIHDPPWLLQGAPGHPGRRGKLYKTGDLLKQNSDGTLDFVGRKDGLIKLRGQRIELTEVEYHVTKCLPPGLCAAAEIILPVGTSSPLLAVFIALRDADCLGKVIEGLEEQLLEIVPRYMVPGAWIPVAAIPMTTTSKTDRRALREIGSKYSLESIAALQSTGTVARPPISDTERHLAALWATILGIDVSTISCASNFMRIGGESIAAMKLVAAARRQKIKITVADIFSNPKLEDLALAAEGAESEQEEEPQHRPLSMVDQPDLDEFLARRVQPLLHGDGNAQKIKDMLPATDFQQQAIDDALQDPPSRWPHWILDLPSDVNFQRLRHACEKLVQHFEILRTVFVRLEGRYWQVILESLCPIFDLIDSTKAASMDAAKVVCEEDLLRPRQLGSSFIRFMAIRHSAGQHKLIFRLSHSQFDGFSFSSVLQTLSQLYLTDNFSIPASFAEVVAFNNSRKQKSLQYWSTKLKDSTFPDWSTSCPSPKNVYSTKDRLLLSKTVPLPDISRCGDISPATVFHAACALVLSQHFGQRDVVFGRLVTGRSMLPSRLQSTVGPLLTEVPIRHTVHQEDTLLDIARQMQVRFIEDSHHEAVGMVEMIRRATDWDGVDFGWRTAFQQEQDEVFNFLDAPSNVSFYEREVLPRTRPEIYATPKDGKLELQFEGNLQLISRTTAKAILGRLQEVLSDFAVSN